MGNSHSSDYYHSSYDPYSSYLYKRNKRYYKYRFGNRFGNSFYRNCYSYSTPIYNSLGYGSPYYNPCYNSCHSSCYTPAAYYPNHYHSNVINRHFM